MQSLLEERKQIKAELDAISRDQALGAQIRSRSKWVEEGEKSTSYFLRLEKYHQMNNCIYALSENKHTFTDDHDILDIAHRFYQSLYSSTDPTMPSISEFLSAIETPKLDETNKHICEGLILKDECREAAFKMKLNKSPGIDGLPIEFYTTFWDQIEPILQDVYNESFTFDLLPLSLRKSVIFLKKDLKAI